MRHRSAPKREKPLPGDIKHVADRVLLGQESQREKDIHNKYGSLEARVHINDSVIKANKSYQ